MRPRIAELLKKNKSELVWMLIEADEIHVPTSIFSTDLGPLEAIVLYLKEKKDMPVTEIALRLNRNKRTIWATYYKAKSANIKLTESGVNIPLNIFSKQENSALESLSHYLKDVLGMKYSEIARLLKRDDRTIWTCYSRFQKKIHTHKKSRSTKEETK